MVALFGCIDRAYKPLAGVVREAFPPDRRLSVAGFLPVIALIVLCAISGGAVRNDKVGNTIMAVVNTAREGEAGGSSKEVGSTEDGTKEGDAGESETQSGKTVEAAESEEFTTIIEQKDASWTDMQVEKIGGNTSTPYSGPHICNYGIHYYIEHAYPCSTVKGEQDPLSEPLGCHLEEFQSGRTFGNISRDRAVHWFGGDPEQDSFGFGGENSSSCMYGDNQGSVGKTFRIPDYCSRAMISELSTVYDGKLRYTNLAAAVRNLFSSTSPDGCAWTMRSPYDKLLTRNYTRPKACWNMVNDWKQLYCVKYRSCRCPAEVTDAECHLHDELVECCRDEYKKFKGSEYWPKK